MDGHHIMAQPVAGGSGGALRPNADSGKRRRAG